MMSAAEVSWWLDYSALPHRELWAKLEVHQSGKATVIDCDGRAHEFSSVVQARDWLQEDEYSMLENLDAAEFMHGVKPLLHRSDAHMSRMLPFLVESTGPSVALFELNDGRFQLLEAVATIGPFLCGPGYLLVEKALARFLVEQGVERIQCEDTIIFDRPSEAEFQTHVRIRVGQYFTFDQIRDLDLVGPRLLTMNDERYFVSPELRQRLQRAPFDYLTFSEGLSRIAGEHF